MASKTSSRPLGLQQKPVGAHQVVKANVPPQDLKSNKQQLAKPAPVTAESKKLPTNPDDSVSVPPGNSDSNNPSAGSEKVSTLDVNEIKSSLEASLDQEKKMSQPGSVKNSSVSPKTVDGIATPAKTSGSAKVSERLESGKSSMCRGSTSTDVSDESTCSSFSSSVNKPHKANDVRWEAIQVVRAKDGAMGLSHFRLLKRLGCGDIGSVYLAELSGTKCYFAMKVMDKASLASRKKLLRAQTEREILQSLDHPFLPSLYTNFETDKFSCLVMEFCPGGDLHTLRQRQPGKYFSEQAVK